MTLPLSLALVATIVAGEVGSTVPAARLPVACTVVADHTRGHDLDARWYGRAVPTPADVDAARTALEGGCAHLPYFRFLGSADDLETWIRLGYVNTHAEIRTWTRGPWTALGVPDVSTPGVPDVSTPAVLEPPIEGEYLPCVPTPEQLCSPSAFSSRSPHPGSFPSMLQTHTNQRQEQHTKSERISVHLCPIPNRRHPR